MLDAEPKMRLVAKPASTDSPASHDWPNRRRGLIQWALVIIFIWEGVLLFDVNLVATVPQPGWFLVVAMVSGPIMLGLMLIPIFRRGKIEHRRANGMCIACGYSLTGNISGVCPECGRRSTN
jgi:hypothetical protein